MLPWITLHPAEDYSTNVDVEFPRNQIVVVESPRENDKMQQ